MRELFHCRVRCRQRETRKSIRIRVVNSFLVFHSVVVVTQKERPSLDSGCCSARGGLFRVDKTHKRFVVCVQSEVPSHKVLVIFLDAENNCKCFFVDLRIVALCCRKRARGVADHLFSCLSIDIVAYLRCCFMKQHSCNSVF